VTAQKDTGESAKQADFGFERVAWDEKKGRVKGVFDSVAAHYDLMNDVMSLGLHRIWKRFTASRSGLRAGDRALDVAAGSADLSVLLARQVGDTGCVVVTDINASMLATGRDRLLNEGMAANVDYVLADAEALPFRDSSFDCVTIGFGLRNVTDKAAALRSMCRVLKPGGRLLILEFSKLQIESLAPVYDAYSFHVLPRLGRWLADDAESYRYLAESIRRHPDQETLIAMMKGAGLERCSFHNLSGGIVALHVGYQI
jgi:demethylmenaquinone methyltransferase/2-methoxy-6-polyprenyl-1,4-benzoquinol methylase